MITFLKKIECTPEQLKKLLETYHQRDNGSTYYRYHVYHALQLSNNLDVSTSTLERHIDVLPPSHIEWLASRIRF
ncbi:hypothetical protein KA013_03155 [Patescibacteria group bacterium]|nr:hypothetical protein [Patescibacteria group bacterium]